MARRNSRGGKEWSPTVWDAKSTRGGLWRAMHGNAGDDMWTDIFVNIYINKYACIYIYIIIYIYVYDESITKYPYMYHCVLHIDHIAVSRCTDMGPHVCVHVKHVREWCISLNAFISVHVYGHVFAKAHVYVCMTLPGFIMFRASAVRRKECAVCRLYPDVSCRMFLGQLLQIARIWSFGNI